MELVYKIPCIGSCFAPNQNPDTTCARRGSNENSLPGKAKFIKVAPYIEWSRPCRACGQVGCFRRKRKPTMQFALTMSILGLLVSIYAAFGMGSSPSLLKGAAWIFGDISLSMGAKIKVYIGLNGHVDVIDCASMTDPQNCSSNFNLTTFAKVADDKYERYIAWSDAASCQTSTGAMSQLFDESLCEKCKDAASSTTTFAIVSILTAVSQITNDLQRMTRYGDVNCKATLARITGCIGFLSGMSTLTAFGEGCYKFFPKEYIGHILEWRLGTAYVLLVIFTALKLLNVLLHWFIPTPVAKGEAPPPDITLVDYLMLGVDEKEKLKAAAAAVPAETVGAPAESV